MNRNDKHKRPEMSGLDAESGAGFAASRRQILAGALIGSAMAILRVPIVTQASAQPAGATVSGPMVHVRTFQDIAARCQGRSAGTAGYEQSALYVEKVVRAAGYDVHRQEFDYLRADVIKQVAEQISPTHRVMPNAPIRGAGTSPDGGHTAEVVRPNDSIGENDASWDGVDVRGKIALIEARGPVADNSRSDDRASGITERGLRFQLERDLLHHGLVDPHSRMPNAHAERIRTAAHAGAIAVIFFESQMTPGGLIYPPEPDLLPATAVDAPSGAALVADLENGPVTVHLDLEASFITHSSFNVIASRPGTTITHLSGAHLDSVPGRPGINDNASAAAVLLETAAELPEEHSMGFAWWGAEEYGLHGSLHYVDALQGTPEFDRLEKYLNLDMVASPNYVICALGDGEDREPYAAHFNSVGQPWVPMIPIGAFGGGSDHAAFAEAGIPWAMLTTGAMDLKTAEEHALFGGTVGEAHDPNYHGTGDDLDNIDATALAIMTRAQITGCMSLIA